jgi:hypothetical protein
MFLLSDFVSVDTLDVKLLSPVTTSTINNNLTVVSNVSKVSNVKEKSLSTRFCLERQLHQRQAVYLVILSLRR